MQSSLLPLGWIASFVTGMTLPLRALRLILSHRALLLWSLFPVIITFMLYGLIVVQLQLLAKSWVQQLLLAAGWNPDGLASWLLLLVTGAILLVTSILTFSIVAATVASPFNDFLAETAEKWTTPPLRLCPNPTLLERVRLIGIDLLKAFAAAGATLLVLLLSWIPVLNVGVLLLACLVITFQFITYPQTRRAQGLRQGATFLRRHLFACLGFGFALQVLFAIPLLSAFILPAAVVGGTLLFARAPGGTDSDSRELRPLS